MERILTLGGRKNEINFSDLDHENEMEINLINTYGPDLNIYLNEDSIILLRNHLNYILNKIKIERYE